MGTLVGSYESIAGMLDEVATVTSEWQAARDLGVPVTWRDDLNVHRRIDLLEIRHLAPECAVDLGQRRAAAADGPLSLVEGGVGGRERRAAGG